MSHVARIELEITDLAALADAATELGMELVRGQTTYNWFGSHVGDYPIPDGLTEADLGRCDHAIRIPGNPSAYEIGVRKNPSGPGWILLWDFWMGGYGLVDRVGPHGQKLKQAYAVAKSKRAATAKGYTYTQQTHGDGTVLLTIRVP